MPRALPAMSDAIACLTIHVLSSSADLSRYSLGLRLGISGNSAETFLYLAADVSSGSADTILVHG